MSFFSFKKNSRLTNQIGLGFLLSFALTFLTAQLTAKIGMGLNTGTDFTVTGLLIALAVFVGLLSVQLLVVRPLETIAKNISSPELSKKLPKFAARELIELEKVITEKVDINNVLSEAESKVRTSQVQMNGIIDASLDAVVLINSAGKVTEWNKQAETLFGWNRKEAIGEEMSDMIIPPKMRKMHHDGIDHYHNTKEGPVINNRVEVPAINRAGEEFPVELTVTPFEIKEETYFSAFVRDLREQKKAEQELATEQERLSVTLKSMAEGVVVTDSEGKILLLNPAATRLLSIKEDDPSNKKLEEFIKNEDFIKSWNTALQTEEQLTNVDFVQNEAEHQVLAATTSKVKLGDSEVLGLITIFRDATEEKEIDRMKSDFVSSVSHELRTPLTSIKGFTATMLKKEDSLDPETRREFLGIIQEETTRLESLIRDILEISVLETGKVSLKLTEVDINETISRVAAIAKPQAERNNVSFKTQEFTPITIKADQEKLQTAILNLATNAIKFTPAGGEVSIAVENSSDSIHIKISDTGLGIPKRDQENIFSRFFRVSRPGTEIQGTGLGLTIVREIAQLHGGEVLVESEIGKGSTFTIQIPTKS